MELDGMLDENFNLTIWKDYPAFISSIFFLYRPFILLFSIWQQQGCNCDGLNRAIQIMKNLVEGQQENGSRGGEKHISGAKF